MLIGLLAMFVLLPGAMYAKQATQALSPASADSTLHDTNLNTLWVAESDGVLKVVTAQGDILFRLDDIDDVRAIAVDEETGHLWLLTKKALHTYDFGGALQNTTQLDKSSKKNAQLVVSTAMQSVWLGSGDSLYRFNLQGVLQHEQQLPAKLVALALDEANRRVWVATRRQVLAYSDTDESVLTLNLSAITSNDDDEEEKDKDKEDKDKEDKDGKDKGREDKDEEQGNDEDDDQDKDEDDDNKIRDIDVDQITGDLWVGLEDRLQRYTPEGQLAFEMPLSGLRHIATADDNYIWVASKRELYRVFTDGPVVIELTPFAKKGIETLVADPSNGDAWVARKRDIIRHDSDGQQVQIISLESKVEGLALFADVIAPTITITSPTEAAILEAEGVVVELNYSDMGSGIDPESLEMQFGSEPLEFSCQHAELGAVCAISTVLHYGTNTLTAIIRDRAGNTSEIAEVVLNILGEPIEIIVDIPQDGELTNQLEQVVQGRLSRTAVLTLDGQAVTLLQDNRFEITVSLQEGQNVLYFDAVDTIGNTAQRAITVDVDSIPPQITLNQPQTDILTRDSLLTLSGSVNEPATLALNGSQLVLDANNAFNVIDQALLEGPNTFSFVATDLAGNQTTLTRTVTRDSQPPIITIASPQDGLITNQTQQLFEGSVSEPVTLSLNDQAVTLATDNTFSAGPLPLVEGDNNFFFRALDPAGNGAIVALTVARDTVAPTISLTSPTDGLRTNSINQIFSGSVSEAVTLTLRQPSGQVTPIALDANNNFSSSPLSLQAGSNVFALTAIDAANNQSQLSVTITLDTEPALITLITPQDNALTNQANVTVTGSLSESASLTLNGQPVSVAQDNTFTSQINLAEGNNSLSLISTDIAGNTNQLTLTVVRDSIAPVISITSPANDSVANQTSQTLTGTLNELAALSLNGQAVTLGTNNSFSVPVALVPGPNVFTFVASDAAGNITTKVLTVNLNSAPVIISTPVTIGTVDANYQYQVITDDIVGGPINYSLVAAPLGMAINASTGLISWRPFTTGTFQVMLEARDSYGMLATQNYTITVDFAPGNLPPGLTPIGNQSVDVGTTLTLDLSATDPDSPELLFMVDPMPLQPGMTLNTRTGVFSFTPSANQVGDHTITFIATDGRFEDRETITITVQPLPGITSLRGQVLTTGGAPLPGVTLEVAGITSMSDVNGFFMLDNLSVAGKVRLLVNGSTVAPVLGSFATVPEIIPVIEASANLLQNPIILLPLDVISADPVTPTSTSVITSSRSTENGKLLEPVTLTIPPNRAINDATGLPFVGDISISRVADPTQGPQPLPPNIELSYYIAIQPFGVTYPEPVPISFPNIENFEPGKIVDVFALNHATGAFEKIGEALVNANGRTIDSIGGIVQSNSWHGIVPQEPVSNTDKEEMEDKKCDEKKDAGCTFNVESGNLGETHDLPSYYSLGKTRRVRLSYNSMSANPRPIITTQTGIGNRAPIPLNMSMNLTVGGVDQGINQFMQSSAVPSGVRGQFLTARPATQFNAIGFLTGVYDYRLAVNCQFPVSRRTEFLNGQTIIQNDATSPFGAGWTLNGLQALHVAPSGLILVTEGNGVGLVFTPINASDYESPPSDFSTLSKNPDGTFRRRMKDGTIYNFNANGRLESNVDRNNNTTNYNYDNASRLITILDPVGEQYTFTYSAGRISSISDPANRTTRFEHDSEGNLIRIIEPTGDVRRFDYEPITHLMTAQHDQRDNRTEYSFNFAGRISGALLPDGSTTSLEPSIVQGLIDPASGLGTKANLAPPPILSRDVQNKYIDHNGNVSATRTDPLRNPTSRLDAVERTRLYQRDVDSNPVRTTRPNKSVIIRTYDDRGNALTRREGFNTAMYRFNYDAFSLVTSAINPRNHTTTFKRDTSGNATQIVNALGHTTTIEYDGRGLVTRMVDPVGLETAYSYNSQGLATRLTQTPPPSSAGNVRVTQYSYDSVGQLTQIITPDAITISIAYDDKGRIQHVSDNLAQSIDFAYDPYDNLIQTDTIDPDSSLVRTVSSVFDSRNRLFENQAPHINKTLSTYHRELDNNSNIVGGTDPKGNSQSYIYDGEDRLTEYTHRLNGVVSYEYDTNDRVTRITASNGVVTDYTYDVLGRKTSEKSPDRGELTYEYDLADNIVKTVDGRGVVTIMTYDELERMETRSYPNALENVTYTYDSCAFGTGKLCARNDESGNYAYAYDAFGNAVSMTRTELGVTYTMAYTYDDGDNVIAMTLPSGREVIYGRDGIRRVASISAQVNGASITLVDSIAYRADNKMTACTLGNGLQDTRSYDQQGRLLTQSLGSVDNRLYAYDANSNLLMRTTTPQTSIYNYDALDRVVGDNVDSSPTDYIYDLNNNRLSRDAANDSNYRFEVGTNRIHSIDSLITNVSENLVIPNRSMSYNNVGRLSQVSENAAITATYVHNGLGQRSRKVTAQGTVVYHYDHAGRLITETQTDGTLIRDYIWHNGSAVVQIDRVGSADVVSYIHTDHLQTPRFATDQQGRVVWRWEGKAFGETLAEQDPDGDGVPVTINLRFLGQYYDAETGLHYNYFRYYDPRLGRYVTSDPIGLLAGVNTYGYVGGNPVNYRDSYGLYALVDDLIAAGIGAVVGVVGQGIGDVISGDLSDIEDYTGAAVGGAAGGVAFLYTGPLGAGAVGGAVTNATKQGLKNLTNKQCGFNGESFVFDTGLGALTGAIPAIPKNGINRGRGSWEHVSKRIMTQLDQGSISNVSNKTLSKMFGVQVWNGSGGIGAGVVAASGAEKIGIGK